MKYIFFYATPADIEPALQEYETLAPLKFVRTDILTTAERAIYLQGSRIPSLGIAGGASNNACDKFMVSLQDTKNHLYSLIDIHGQQRWALRNVDNPETVLLTLGGLRPNGILIEGHMNTLHDTPVAQKLMRGFRSALKQKGFAKHQNCWIGRDAFAMLKAGKQLTQAEQAPLECDLKWPMVAS